MPPVHDLLTHDDPRVEILRDGETATKPACVLLWVQRTKRATGSHAANLAVELADELDLPVVAGFALAPGYPEATLRAYQFMAEGLAELPDAFARRGIGWELVVGEPPDVIPALAKRLGAALIVTDLDPLRVGRGWRAAIARTIDVPLVQVDSDTIVPSSLFPQAEFAPRTIRPKLLKRLDEFLRPIPDPKPKQTSEHREGPDPLREIARPGFALDRDVGPSNILTGGATEAERWLTRFLDRGLPQYDTVRDRSDLDETSHLSPYLHYGQIGPTEIVLAARERISGEHYDSLLDEILVQRELSINYALRVPDYDHYQGLPEWGRRELEQHADDPRPVTYTVDQLAASETHDDLWNAAQRQMVVEGFLNNRLRLYWGKQIVLWSRTPREAWDNVVHLNNTYFVCGRDANSYANIAWVVGGRHDRPFPADRPITGTIRPMTIAAMKRSFRPQDYIDRIDELYGVPEAKPLPDDEPTQKRLDV